eukprot:TRINITY_DN25980_c0_g1_i2.p1 TRINITY_DN25980_c0_g1~~TRINITY_DN25980_c0_g1_i2.p1  ORF type:complete len:235 (-),score=21.17 TRINITY_DN25980_c0_g1_i2:301-1005(-)
MGFFMADPAFGVSFGAKPQCDRGASFGCILDMDVHTRDEVHLTTVYQSVPSGRPLECHGDVVHDIPIPFALTNPMAHVLQVGESEGEPCVPSDEDAPARLATETHVNDTSVDAFTTLMIQNLPPATFTQDVLQQLDNAGFGGLYDIVYVPFRFGSDCNMGFAFVNFTTHEFAKKFLQYQSLVWQSKAKVSLANVQGRVANLKMMRRKKIYRIHDPKLQPYIRAEDMDAFPSHYQ